jgi:hypothetical protein
MEKYQALGLICSATGVGIGMVLLLSSVTWEIVLGLPIWFFSFIGIYFPLLDTRRHKTVGWYYLIAGVLFNWLMIIPAVLAFRHKPSNAGNRGVAQQSFSLLDN